MLRSDWLVLTRNTEINLDFVEILRSDWLIPTSLLGDLKNFLGIFDGLVESACLSEAASNVAVRRALAGDIA
jgi:hypothetical protein